MYVNDDIQIKYVKSNDALHIRLTSVYTAYSLLSLPALKSIAKQVYRRRNKIRHVARANNKIS